MRMLRSYKYVKLLFLLCIFFIPTGSGCISKVERACRNDQDCRGFYPKIFCYKGVCSKQACDSGEKKSCFGGPKETLNVGQCRAGTMFCQTNGRWGNCEGQVLPGHEICDKVDNDCDGKIDENPNGTTSSDWCKCKVRGAKKECYTGSEQTKNKGECSLGVQYCEQDFLWGKCQSESVPKTEICDGKDNDCNGKIDDSDYCSCAPGDQQLCYTGPSKNLGIGRCTAGLQTCRSDRTWGSCKGQIAAADSETCGNQIDDDCDGMIDNGCTQTCKEPTFKYCRSENKCIDLQTSSFHCGACDNAVSANFQCCQGSPTEVQTDPKNCGRCGKTCKSSETCLAGICRPSCGLAYPKLCGTQCINPKQDPRHCGDCNQACTAEQFCKEGACTSVCSAPFGTSCNGQCTNTKNDPKNCGTCGKTCQTKQLCNNGICEQCQNNLLQCGSSCCTTGQTCCGGACVDLKQDPKHCGACSSAQNPSACAANEICKTGNCQCVSGANRLCFPPEASGCVQKKDGSFDCKGICEAGVQTCSAGTWGACSRYTIPRSYEICNRLDDDCNGSIDDPGKLKNYEKVETSCDGIDNDCDGTIDPASICSECIPTHQVRPPISTDYFHIRIGNTRHGNERIAVHPNGKWVAWTQYPNTGPKPETQVIVWDGTNTKTYRHPFSSIQGLSFSHDGTKIIAGGGKKISIHLLGTQTPKNPKFLNTSSTIRQLKIDTKDEILAVATGRDIELWDLNTLAKIAVLKGHTGLIDTMDITLDGTKLASGALDKTVLLWDLKTKKIIQRHALLGTIASLKFSKDGKLLAIGTRKDPLFLTRPQIILMDVAKWAPTTIISDGNPNFKDQAHFSDIKALTFSSRGSLLFSTGGFPDYSLRIWDIKNPKRVILRKVLYGVLNQFIGIHTSNDGKTLVGGDSISVRQWRCAHKCDFSKVTPNVTSAHNNIIVSVGFAPDEFEHVITASQDGTVKFWAGSTFATKAKTLPSTTGFTEPVVFAQSPPYYHTLWFQIASGKTLSFWVQNQAKFPPTKQAIIPKSKTKPAHKAEHKFSDTIRAVAIHPTQNNPVAVATIDKKLHILDTFSYPEMKVTKTFPLSGVARTIQFSADGKWLAAGYNGKVTLWDTRTFTATNPTSFTFDAPKTSVTPPKILSVVFHPTDSSLIAVSFDTAIVVWKIVGKTITTKHKLKDLGKEHTALVTSLAFSPDGERLLSGGLDSKVKVWDWKTGKRLYDLQGNITVGVTSVSWRSDGKVIAAGTEKGSLFTWVNTTCP